MIIFGAILSMMTERGKTGKNKKSPPDIHQR